MATDQEIRDAGFKYIPQQKYLQNPFEIPTAPAPPPPVSGGITNTNAFANSGGGNDFNLSGNAFGYGTAVQPGDKSVLTSGPYEGQSGYYNSKNYRGGLPGNIQQKGPGRFFDYGQKNEAGESVFYKDETLQPKKQLPSWMKAAMAFAPGGTFLANRIENKMNPGYMGITQQQIDEDYGGGGGNYGIAGLSDAQKQNYDALAGQGYLFDGPGGMKTLTGKNFTGKGYLEGQLELAEEFGFDNMTDQQIADAIKEEEESQLAKGHTSPGFKYKQMLEASAMYKANKGETIKDPSVTTDLVNEFTTTTTNNNNNNNDGGSSGTPPGFGITPQGNYVNQFEGGDPGQNQGGQSQNNNQNSSSVSNQESQENAAYDFASGGRVKFNMGGAQFAAANKGEDISPGTDSGGNFRDGNNNNNNNDNNNQVITNPVDISTITKSIGDYDIPYGLEALLSDKGKFQAVLNADNILDKNLGLDFTYDQGPYQVGFNADMEGNKNLGLSYNKGNLSAYANTDFNDPSVGFKYSKAFAYGGLASIL